MDTINQTKFKVGQRAIITSNTQVREDHGSLIGHKGKLAVPFASGCTDPGWVGFRSDKYTPYGYNFNMHESEIELIEQ